MPPLAANTGPLDRVAEAEGRAARRLSVGARVAAGAAAALALAALVGWAAGASRLTTLLESGPSMSPSSALCALLGAWAVFRLAPGGDRPVAARAAALGILAIVAGNLAWAVLGLPLRPEALLLADPAATRMAVPSCIGFALLAAAVATLDAAGPARRFGGGAGIAGLLLGVFAVAGYLIDYNSLYGLPAFAPMSLPTALSLLLLSAAALAVRPGAGPGGIVAAGGQGGVLARRLLPAVLLIPLTLGWLAMRGVHQGAVHAGTAIVLLTVGSIALLSALAWRLSAAVERTDRERRQAIAAMVAAVADKDALLGEKDVLMREVNHRVKNSLQIVSSLLDMQSRRMRHAEAKAAIGQAAKQVVTIARIHERLYQDEDVRTVAFDEYLAQLCADLERAAKVEGRSWRVALEAAPLALATDRAVPLALAVTELVTNAFKYANPEGGGVATVRLAVAGDSLVVTVADDGAGLPADFDPRSGDSLGLKVVLSLAGQIGGRLSWEAGAPGALFRLEAPL